MQATHKNCRHQIAMIVRPRGQDRYASCPTTSQEHNQTVRFKAVAFLWLSGASALVQLNTKC
jgi:hypothetical protein